MIKIYIYADSHKHFTQSIEEYKKRLGKDIDLIELKPLKKGNSDQIISTETHLLREKLLKESGYKIVLSPQGKNISTEGLGEVLRIQKNQSNNIIFIIGGAGGLDYDVLRDVVDFELSLGKMILPHGMALLMILEQIYRCREIERGTGYHK